MPEPQIKVHDEKTLLRLAESFVRTLFFLIFAGILVLVLGFGTKDHYLRVIYDLPNGLLLVLGLFITALGIWLFQRISSFFIRRYNLFSRKYANQWALFVAIFLLFFVQMVIAINIMFRTGWDARILIDYAYMKTTGQPTNLSPYFSIYPNNLLLSWIYIQIMSLTQFILGTSEYHVFLFSLIIFNSIISCITSYLLFKTVHLITGRLFISWIAWCVYAVVVGLSPWFLIPYSDTAGILFPILMIYLYVKPKQDIRLQWVLIAACFYIGFRIKPTSAISFIAIVLVEIVSILSRKPNVKKLLSGTVSLLATIVLLHTCYTTLLPASLGVTLDKEKVFGPLHFVKMGLNNISDGVYLDEDVVFTNSFNTRREQDAANLQVIKDRLKGFGFKGYLDFLVKKALINFNNGTFAWSFEGEFFGISYSKLSLFSAILMSFVYPNSSNYHIFLTLSQALWLTVLSGTFLFSFRKQKTLPHRKQAMVIKLALIGLVIYVMLFEARARYLYTSLPLFILAAILGFQDIIYTLRICHPRNDSSLRASS